MENPQTGYLKSREVVAGLPWQDITYCKYGLPYKKQTRLWGFFPFKLRGICCVTDPCAHVAGGLNLSGHSGSTRETTSASLSSIEFQKSSAKRLHPLRPCGYACLFVDAVCQGWPRPHRQERHDKCQIVRHLFDHSVATNPKPLVPPGL